MPTWVFVSAYLLIWMLFGGLAYGIASGAQALAGQWMWLADNAGRVGGGVLVLAGLYELSPLKQVCLSRCRTPFQFILTSWRSGYVGASRMGLEHGVYCLGCCWLLFMVLFPIGIMNVAAMALITLLIFAEKSLRHGERVGQVAAAAMIAYGALAMWMPGVLPTMVR